MNCLACGVIIEDENEADHHSNMGWYGDGTVYGPNPDYPEDAHWHEGCCPICEGEPEDWPPLDEILT